MKIIIVTNNRTVCEAYKDRFELIFSENYSYKDILEIVRTNIHKGSKLLTHPLSGSVKPNETPFKTILISKEREELDFEGLNIIEESIMTYNKFINNKNTPDWTKRILDDFQVIDFSLIENAIKSII